MSTLVTDKMLYLRVPDDPDFLRAFARLTISHAHLDHILRMTIKTLSGVSPKVAIDATSRQGSAELRERIRKLARHALGEGSALLQLQALLNRCEQATRRRNEIVHGLIGQELDGELTVMTDANIWRSLPLASEVDALQSQIEALWQELNTLRLEGPIKETLERRRQA